jgi:hypothetical protein
MTRLLEKAFKEVAKLPEVEQNALAKWVMEEIEAEGKWAKAFEHPRMFWISLLTMLLPSTSRANASL